MRPQPKMVEVCNLCDLPWQDHLRQALAKMEEEGLIPDDEYWPHDDPRIMPLMRDCIALLKKANQGPMGPVGPTGPMGLQGPEGPRSEPEPFMGRNPYA